MIARAVRVNCDRDRSGRKIEIVIGGKNLERMVAGETRQES